MNLNTPIFDFIIVGAGSAGCALANKLSENGRFTVLLLEQGKRDSSPLLKMPKGFGAVLAGDTYVSRYAVTGSDDPANNALTNEIWLRGKTLGGSSSVNGMIWARPQPEGFDILAQAGGDAWSWSQMQPYLDALDGGGSNHGFIPTSPHKTQYAITEAFIKAAESVGLPRHERMIETGQYGAAYLHYNIDAKGKRVSAATAFLKPLSRRSNVRILTNCQVEKVAFTGKRASAVMCLHNGERKNFTAQREIILSAGTLESPQILQRSGIGPELLLNELGIELVHKNDNVGANLREHFLLSTNFDVKSRADSENQQYSGMRLLWNVLRYGFARSGPMAQSPCHAAAFLRSSPTLDKPDIQLMLSPFSREGDDFSASPGISIVGYPMYPKSAGDIRICSTDPSVQACIKPNYLSHDDDKKVGIAALRLIRKITSQLPLSERLVQESSRSAAAQSDDDIVEYYKANGQPGFHATGTCAMGLNSTGSVVDGNARVHGVDGLRVVDCSIYPQMISGVTNASVMAIAMRAADLILEEHYHQCL